MTEHNKLKEMINRYVDGDLNEQEKQELDEHLKRCPSCRSVLSAFKSISEATEASLKEPPADFKDSVMAAIKNLPADAPKSVPFKPHRKTIKTIAVTFAAAAACLALVLIAAPDLLGKSASTKDAAMSAPDAAPKAHYEMAEAADEEGATLSGDSTDQMYPVAGGGGGGGVAATDDCALDNAATDDSADFTAGSAASDAKEDDNAANEAPIDSAGVGTLPTQSKAPDTDGGMGMLMAVPSPNPSPDNRIVPERLQQYYAVFYIDGQLPEIVSEEDAVTAEDGTKEIVITVETADTLLNDGYVADLGNPDAENALVVHTLSS